MQRPQQGPPLVSRFPALVARVFPLTLTHSLSTLLRYTVEVDTAASIACGWAMTTMTSLRINDHISKNGRSLYSEVAVPNSRSKFFAQVVQVRPPLLRARAPKRASGSSAPATDANTGMKSRRARRESHPSRVRAKRAQRRAKPPQRPSRPPRCGRGCRGG